MSKSGTPVILDSWLCLLGQLNAEKGVIAKELVNLRGRRFQSTAFMLLKSSGLIDSASGKWRGYRLRYPLTKVPFSTVINLWSLSSRSYIRKLFLRYSNLSLDEVIRLPQPSAQNDSTYSFDSVCHVIRSLRYNEFTLSQYFYPSKYCPAYGAHIAKQLEQARLVMYQPGKGFILLKRHEEILVGDLISVVSSKCLTLNKIMLLAKDVPVISILK